MVYQENGTTGDCRDDYYLEFYYGEVYKGQQNALSS